MLAFLSMHCGFSHRKFQKLRWASTLNKNIFCDHLLVHNPIWVWSKILDGDSNIPQDYGIYTHFSSYFPSLFMLEDEHRSSMGEESLPHLWQIVQACKYYVAKSSEEQKKKNENEKKYDEKKTKVRKIGRIKWEKKEREKMRRKKIKLRKIMKMLIGSFYFISSQVPWWQIHTQIFQPCAIR
jgi:hypothetical protein